MKKKIKEGLGPVVLAIICGSICGKLVCNIYTKDILKEASGDKVYLVQSGAYSTYDNMIDNTNVSNYIYYEDTDGLYKTVIGFTTDYDNIEKISNIYDGDVLVNEYYSKDQDLNNKIKEYDSKIENTDDQNEIKSIVLEMLGLYENKENSILLKEE